MAVSNVGNTDILDTIDFLSNEKTISKESVINAIEVSAVQVSKDRYGQDSDIVARVNRKSGELQIYRIMTVVEDVNNINTELSLKQALSYDREAKLGDKIQESLPNIHSERQTANNMKGILLKEIRSIEKEIEFNDYSKRQGEITTGMIKKVAHSHMIVGIGGKTEAIIFKSGLLPGEVYNVRDKITAFIQEVNRSNVDFQIVLSRTSNEFLGKLFYDEVREISEGLIDIKAIARDPGSRAKIAVSSNDPRFDAVGACIGPRGSRVMSIMSELKGEKIDIVGWDRDIAVFAKNAIIPAKAIKATYIADNNKIEIVIPDESLSMAIGRRGQNAKLASQIIGCDIDLISESDKKTKAMTQFKQATELILYALDVEEIIAQLLVSEGFITVESIANSTIDKITKIDGFDNDIAMEIQQRAIDCLNNKSAKSSQMVADLNIDPQLQKMPHLRDDQIFVLHNNKINTLTELADLAGYELAEIVGGLTEDQANDVVMAARKIIYKI